MNCVLSVNWIDSPVLSVFEQTYSSLISPLRFVSTKQQTESLGPGGIEEICGGFRFVMELFPRRAGCFERPYRERASRVGIREDAKPVN